MGNDMKFLRFANFGKSQIKNVLLALAHYNPEIG